MTSHFLAKGTLYSGTRSYFDSEVPGKYQALLEALKLKNPDLHVFMSQKFLDSVMYDVMWVPALVPIEAKVAGKTVANYLLHRTKWQAQRDLEGTYKALLKCASPDLAIKLVPRVMIQMFNFGHPETIDVMPKGYKVILFKGIPNVLLGWLENAFHVYAKLVIEIAGGVLTDFFIDPPISEGVKDGVPISTLTVNISYENK